jgi:hypothetical protein
MRTSFHHQPEAQHPNSSSTSWQADYPIFRGQSGHAVRGRDSTPCRSRKFHPRGFARLGRISASSDAMIAILHLLGTFVADLFKSRRRLEIENLFLRHQLSIALRRAPDRDAPIPLLTLRLKTRCGARRV